MLRFKSDYKNLSLLINSELGFRKNKSHNTRPQRFILGADYKSKTSTFDCHFTIEKIEDLIKNNKLDCFNNLLNNPNIMNYFIIDIFQPNNYNFRSVFAESKYLSEYSKSKYEHQKTFTENRLLQLLDFLKHRYEINENLILKITINNDIGINRFSKNYDLKQFLLKHYAQIYNYKDDKLMTDEENSHLFICYHGNLKYYSKNNFKEFVSDTHSQKSANIAKNLILHTIEKENESIDLNCLLNDSLNLRYIINDSHNLFHIEDQSSLLMVYSKTTSRPDEYFPDLEFELIKRNFKGLVLIDLLKCNGENMPGRYITSIFDGEKLSNFETINKDKINDDIKERSDLFYKNLTEE